MPPALARSSRRLPPRKTTTNALASTRVARCRSLASEGNRRTSSSVFVENID
jgi:hypothetical protein